MRFLKLLFFLLLMMLGVVFAVMNAGSIHLNYYFGVRDLPLPLVLLAALGVGALLGVLAAMGGVLRLKKENMDLRRNARLASEEVNNLRAIPIKE